MPPTAHAKLAPSSAKSWSQCTAGPLLLHTNPDRIPEDRGSIYAQEGTDAHDLAERVLTGKLAEADLPEQFASVAEYTSRCETLRNRWGGVSFVEEKVPLYYSPEETGTVDFALLCAEGLFIRDLKFGAGIPVAAENNPQLAIYARSLVIELEMLYPMPDDLPVSLGIISPRYSGVEMEQLWTLTVGELKAFCEPIGQAAADILLAISDPIAHLKSKRPLVYAPSCENCRWCKAKTFCKFRYTDAFNSIDPTIIDNFELVDDATEIALPDFSVMTDKQKAGIFLRIKDIEAILSTIKDEAQRLAESGNPLPGTKLVSGRQGNTEWADEELAIKALTEYLSQDKLFTRKLLSPTQALAQLKGPDKEAVKLLTRRSPGKPVVASADDPRPAITATIDAFSTVNDSDDD